MNSCTRVLTRRPNTGVSTNSVNIFRFNKCGKLRQFQSGGRRLSLWVSFFLTFLCHWPIFFSNVTNTGSRFCHNVRKVYGAFYKIVTPKKRNFYAAQMFFFSSSGSVEQTKALHSLALTACCLRRKPRSSRMFVTSSQHDRSVSAANEEPTRWRVPQRPFPFRRSILASFLFWWRHHVHSSMIRPFQGVMDDIYITEKLSQKYLKSQKFFYLFLTFVRNASATKQTQLSVTPSRRKGFHSLRDGPHS